MKDASPRTPRNSGSFDDNKFPNSPDLMTSDADQPFSISEDEVMDMSCGELYPQRTLLMKLMLSRDTLEQWLTEPYFDRLVKGCFVRVNVGESPLEPLYCLKRIEEVKEGIFYAYRLGNVSTTVGLVLSGSNRSPFSLLAVSNGTVEETELQQWEEEMMRNNSQLHVEDVVQKEEMLTLLKSKYSEQEELDISSLLS